MSAAVAQPFNQVRPARRQSAMRRRRARTLRVLALLVVLAGVLVIAPRAVFPMAHTEAGPTVTYKVERGDTLWDIAARYSAGQDVRRVIDQIKDANGLESATVHPGQTLVIPQAGR